jgi:hypothetical protein
MSVVEVVALMIESVELNFFVILISFLILFDTLFWYESHNVSAPFEAPAE